MAFEFINNDLYLDTEFILTEINMRYKFAGGFTRIKPQLKRELKANVPYTKGTNRRIVFRKDDVVAWLNNKFNTQDFDDIIMTELCIRADFMSYCARPDELYEAFVYGWKEFSSAMSSYLTEPSDSKKEQLEAKIFAISRMIGTIYRFLPNDFKKISLVSRVARSLSMRHDAETAKLANYFMNKNSVKIEDLWRDI